MSTNADAAERFDDLDDVVIDDLADEDGDDGRAGCLACDSPQL